MKTIFVSSIKEAISKARELFENGEEFVLVEGSATVGGAMFEERHGSLLLHSSERATQVHHGDIEAAKAKLTQ